MMTSLSKPAGYGCYGWQLATTQGAPPRRSGHVISVKTRKIAVLRNTYELTDRLRIVGHPCSGTPPGPGGSADLLTPDKQGSNKAGPKLLRVEEVARRRLWDRPSKTAFKTVQASTPASVARAPPPYPAKRTRRTRPPLAGEHKRLEGHFARARSRNRRSGVAPHVQAIPTRSDGEVSPGVLERGQRRVSVIGWPASALFAFSSCHS
jgi:hypothetical protein